MESMGLAAPRRKSKYDIDPRNNAWANDENKFGQKLMEKFGWAKGKGLGAQEDGETENIKVKVKNDKHGVGANNDYSDTWLDHQDDFNSILASLNTSHSAPGSGTATPTTEELDDVVVGSMEERSKISKSRVHYKKFTQGKDLARANAKDLEELFGRRKTFEKRSRKVKKAIQSEPASPFAGMTPLGTTPEGGNSPRRDEAALRVEEADGSGDKEYDVDGNLRTVTSTLSVSDYFAKKMAEMTKRNGAVSAAVEQFCENSARADGSPKKEEGEGERGDKALEEKKTTDVDEEKPEIYAQEKFHPATLTVQQYFEQKMKNIKAKEAAALSTSGDNYVEGQSIDQVGADGEKKKKKKTKKTKKRPDGQESDETAEKQGNFQKVASEKRKKKKMKGERQDCTPDPVVEGSVRGSNPQLVEEEKTKKKKKKTKLGCGETQVSDGLTVENRSKKRKRKLENGDGEPGKHQVVEPEMVKKKKKKKKKKKTSAGEIASPVVDDGSKSEKLDSNSDEPVMKTKVSTQLKNNDEPDGIGNLSTTTTTTKKKKKKKQNRDNHSCF